MSFKTDYIIKEKEGVVVCIISRCECNAFNLIEDEDLEMTVIPSVIDLVDEKFLLNPVYKGIARCNHNDVFNVELGKKIAYRKAHTKYIAALEKKTNLIIDNYKKETERTIAHFDNVLKRLSKRVDNTNKLLNEVLEIANK